MDGGSDAIPSINITTDFPSDPPSHSPRASSSHHIQPSGLLSPSHGPPSPVLSDISESGSGWIPPSPTLSNYSGHFPSTLQLRDNKPEEKSGFSSLGLLNPGGYGHHRKGSNATSLTEVARSDDHHAHSNTTSVTNIDQLPNSPINEKMVSGVEEAKKSMEKKSRNDKNGDDTEEDHLQTTHQIELAQDAAINPAPFHFKPYELAHMLDLKSIETLVNFGGIDGLLQGLGTNADTGLVTGTQRANSSDSSYNPNPAAGQGASQRHDVTNLGTSEHSDVPVILLTDPNERISVPSGNDKAFAASMEDRRRVYGENVLPTRITKTLLQLMWAALKDKVLILLSIAAVVSLALGFFQDFGPSRNRDDPPVDWVEGVAIMVAIAIVVVVGSLNDWQKERQFKALNERKEERGVKVIRDGVEKMVDIKEVVVGDIALLEPGEVVPCDGIFISGHNVRCDESGATGESDAISKASFTAVRELYHHIDPEHAHKDCFIISGSKVLEGVGKYVIVAVGNKSFNGRIMMALRGDTEDTPLQVKLNNLAELIAKIGSAAGLALFSALMIRFFVQLGTGEPPRNSNQNGIAFVNILIIAVTLIVVAVPEGLPLAVTLALAFATKRMTRENLLVRVLGSCETMANASVICTDKTGTLTQNAMTVVAGSVGIHAKFVRNLNENAARTNAEEIERSASGTEITRKHPLDFSIEQSQLNTVLSHQIQALFNEAIAINSTAFEDTDPDTGDRIFIGSKTETALLQFAKELGWPDFTSTRHTAKIVQMFPFSSERKCMGVVIKRNDGGYRAYFKGASEILAKRSTHYIVLEKEQSGDDIKTEAIDELAQENISRTIIFYANQTLRTIALCYRDFESWPHDLAIDTDRQSEVPFDLLCQKLVLIGITGIEDPLREGVRDAVAKCHQAGVTVKMCTGDNVLTARSIASQCGIFTKGGIIMEGPVFRRLSHQDRIEIIPRLQVLARSSPEDKKLLVETLKKTGETVGVTGDGTNDGPALKTANVGFSMGIAGTEVAKEASDIILMDDNFSSIVKAIMWGRCVNDAVRKFLQFQISTNITAVVITFISAVASVEETSVLSAVQLLWINIIMDTFAALALATDPASEKLLERKPERKHAPLFSVDMYKMILLQSIYQIIITLVFHFRGLEILGLESTTHNIGVVKTLVFNAFVFAQIFNSVNCRRLDNKLNIFEGISHNPYFIGITLLEIIVQVLIVFVGGAAFQVVRIGGREWGISLALGFVSIPWGAVIRCIPNGPFEAFFKFTRLMKEPEVLPTVSPEKEGWGGAISIVRDNLRTFANIRGGRVRSSSFVIKSRSARLSQDEPLSMPYILAMAMAPTIVLGAIASGSSYLQTGSLSDPAHADPSKSSAALWEGKLQIHPETPPHDPVYQKFSGKENMA